MNRRSARSWRPAARGVTLVEALAGIAILGTLLAGIVVANARQVRQSAQAALRVQACAIADELLEQWWPSRQELPRSDAGKVPGHENWTWRTRPVDDQEAAAMGLRIIRLDIFGPGAGDAPSARVEIVLPSHDKE